MNSTAIPADVGATRRSSLSGARLLRAHLVDSKYEFLRLGRNPAFYIPMVALPTIMYLLIGVLYVGNMEMPAGSPLTNQLMQKLMFANFIVFGVMGPAIMSFGAGIASERDGGTLDFKRALPMPPFAYLLSKLAMAFLFGCIAILAMTVVAVAFSDAQLTFGQYFRLFVVTSVSVLPFCAMGLAIGASLPMIVATPLANIAWMAFSMLAGLLFPLPESAEWIKLFSPPYYVSQLNMGIVGMPTFVPAWVCVTVLLVLTPLLIAFSIRRLDRAER
jgi:ABC-2 type transport system permease protein